jgi:3-keto-disaccharide hydrolase
MQTVMEALEGFEKLIYKILVWIVLIPKTLLTVVLQPDWAPKYIKKELGEGKSRFDEYFSPVVLLLLVAVLPSLLWNFLPVPGVEITSPSTEYPTRARKVDFEANIKFISTSTDGFVTTYWRVEQEFFDGVQYQYPVLTQDRYTNNHEEGSYFDYYRIDVHTIRDIYQYEFPAAGNYWVAVDASKFDSQGRQIEAYSSVINIYVPPDDSQENVTVNARSKPSATPFSFTIIGDQLKSEKTIFLALGLLIPPLLFALAIKLFSKEPLSEDNKAQSSEDRKERLSEDSMKETFYVQCYYFAPIAFVFWATRYAEQFFTRDVFFRYDTDLNLIVLLPLFLAGFWFVAVQTRAVAREANIGGMPAFFIVLVCIFVLGAGGLLVVLNDDPGLQDMARKSSIWLYPLLAAGLLVMYHILVIVRKRRENLTVSRGDKVLVGGIGFIVFISLCLVLVLGAEVPLTSQDFDVTQQSYAAKQMAELVSFEAQKFYTEEFDGEIPAWGPPFMTSGDINHVKYSTENGSLVFEISPLEDQASTYSYFVNTAFLYTDAEVKTVVANKEATDGKFNLICRAGGSGWYEFEISSSGEYAIYAYDAANQAYNVLASGESSAINTGLAENTFTAICKGNELSLIINDTSVATVPDTKSNFTEGFIGVGVASEGAPVTVEFAYVKVSETLFTPEVIGGETPTEEIPVEAIPTEAQAPETQGYYTEEFDGNLDSWTSSITGEESQVKTSMEDGSLVFHLAPSADTLPTIYYVNENFTYTDVQVDVVTTNNGNNSNAVVLVCQINEGGWYEFNVSNSGIYSIYVWDAAQEAWSELDAGNSSSIGSGLATNTYTAVCRGSDLSLFVNGELAANVVDTTFNFSEGSIGFGVSATQAVPIDLSIDSLTVSRP